MKLNMKRVLLGLCMVTCLFSLSACGSRQDAEELDPMKVSYAEQTGQGLLKEFVAVPDDQIDLIIKQMLESGQESDAILATALESWKGTKEDLGALKSVGDATVKKTEDGYSVDLDTVFEKRNMVFSIGQNENLTEITYISFNPVYTTGEKLEQAGLNTLLGMGTVFIILVFISLLIGCFKYINQWEEKVKNKNKIAELEIPVPAAVPVSPSAAAEEENLAGDLELVAVITAAIAASAGTTPDGLVVRSIRRAPVSKWKKA